MLLLTIEATIELLGLAELLQHTISDCKRLLRQRGIYSTAMMRKAVMQQKTASTCCVGAGYKACSLSGVSPFARDFTNVSTAGSVMSRPL